MNQCNFIGNLTKDPELTTTTNGVNKVSFTIAVNREYKKDDGTSDVDFFNCIAWRGLADTINKFCKKGKKIFITGEMQNRSYEDNNGVKRYITELIVNKCQFLSMLENSQSQNNKLTPIEDSDMPF